MEKVTVRKDELIKALLKNKEKHADDYKAAVEGFKIEAREQLEEALERMGKKSNTNIHISLVHPMSYEKQYDQALLMLEMSIDDQISISYENFAEFVMDDWGWKKTFSASNSTYFTKVGRPLP